MTFYYVIFSKFTIFTNSKQLAFKVGGQNINILRYADVIVQQSENSLAGHTGKVGRCEQEGIIIKCKQN